MKDISAMLKDAYNAHRAVIVPGSGTFGMEAVARQFARDKKCLVIRNGWFSYRWSQIFEMGNIPAETIVLKARREKPGSTDLLPRSLLMRQSPPSYVRNLHWYLPRTWKLLPE